MSSDFRHPPLDDYNAWADFWRYEIGVNVIPADTREKKPLVSWLEWQDKPILRKLHDQWKLENTFSKGLAIIPGNIWHREDKNDLYLIFIDLDRKHAIEEICSKNGAVTTLEQMAQKILVEQHKDNLDKAHVYFYSPVPFPKKGADGVIGIEVKGLGEHGLAFCSPSIHRDGHPYEIIGTTEPLVLNTNQAEEMMQHINRICLKYGVEYLEKESKFNRLKPMIQRLIIDPTLRIPRGERHLTLLSTADSLLIRHSKRKKSESRLKDFFIQINNKLCDPEPLPENEINTIWKDALDFAKIVKQNDEVKGLGEEDKEQEPSIIEQAGEAIRCTHNFATIAESKDILYYKDGVYIPGGEVLIEKEAEKLFGYDLYNKDLAEIKGHIMRKTYRSRTDFDAELNILNLRNGLYTIITGEFNLHTPDYLSINQIPITYNPKAKSKHFGKYLKEVLYPTEIRTAVELMAYTFYRDNPFEIITVLFGYGANGKSVFTGLLTSLHGANNVSNVPLTAMIKNTFALSDLENKDINIDTELSSATIHDSAILKKLTGRQPIRIEQKNQRAYDALLHAKLIFSANKIPHAADDSDAYYRRNIIVRFPNKFEGDKEDQDLLKKLTTEEELSAIFNILMIALRNILKNKKIFLNEKTIQERREKYELVSRPIECFKKDAIAEDSTELDYTTKEDLYRAYEIFAKKNKLAVESKENFGKILKKNYEFQEGRESSGRRKTFWRGVRLTDEYRQVIASEQQTLAV